MSEQKHSWRRYRFYANENDSRPIRFPPPGPWWETGLGDGYSIVVAYLPTAATLTKYWPEETNVDYTDEQEIVYSERFPKPDWYKP